MSLKQALGLWKFPRSAHPSVTRSPEPSAPNSPAARAPSAGLLRLSILPGRESCARPAASRFWVTQRLTHPRTTVVCRGKRGGPVLQPRPSSNDGSGSLACDRASTLLSSYGAKTVYAGTERPRMQPHAPAPSSSGASPRVAGPAQAPSPRPPPALRQARWPPGAGPRAGVGGAAHAPGQPRPAGSTSLILSLCPDRASTARWAPAAPASRETPSQEICGRP